MGDMGEVFNAMRGATQERHAEWKRQNLTVLDASEFPYRVTNGGETLLFREPDMPKADFYPSTGRWRVAGVSKTFRGGAAAFLGWYRKQRRTEPVSCPVNDPSCEGGDGDCHDACKGAA